MSHYKVLVIGDNIDDQLAPYDENLEVEAYQDPDFNFTEALERARAFYREQPEYKAELDRNDDRAILAAFHEGEDLRWNEDGTASLWSTYNPKSKWDWWTIGGRYNASFKVKPDAPADYYRPSERHWSEEFGNEADHAGAADRAQKRAIDFDAMVQAATRRAEGEWSHLAKVTQGLTPPACGWDEHRAKYDDIDEARRTWHSHPWNAAARGAGFWDAFDFFRMDQPDPQAAFMAWNKDIAVTGFYAIVKDGEWVARGDMGWFGMSTDKVNEDEWRGKVRELIESLPDDTWMTTVDAHI